MKKTNYDVSIISPVYNAEEYIEAMMDSIIKQTHDFNKIELLMVNDGSPDNSKEKILEYSKKYPNIILIDKPNGGVSSARNAGIKKATGKYIMLVDPDDYLGPKSVHSLYEFMEANKELDVSTYKMINVWPSGKKTDHFRMKLFDKGTAIYDLTEYPFNTQTCVNVFFRNRFEKNILYDEDMSYAEDEKYNTELLLETEKLGFVKEAIYYYRRHGNGQASKDLLNPLFSLEGVLDYYEKNFAKSLELHGYVSKYIQCLFLNAIRWRIFSDQLFPYHLEGKEYDKVIDRINNLIKQLDVKTLIENPFVNKYYKFYLLDIMGIKPKIKLENNHFIITDNDLVLEEANRIALMVSRFRINDYNLNIIGNIRSIILNFEKPSLILKKRYNDGRKEEEIIDIKDSINSSYNSKMRITDSYAFDLNIDLRNISELKFIVKIKDYTYNCNYEFEPTAPFFKKFRMKSYKTDKLDIKFNNYGFEFKKKSIFNNVIFNLIRFGVIVIKSPKALFYRMARKKYKNDRVWLYCDRRGIIDNGYYQFKHDIKIKDGIKRYYIYDDSLEKMKEYFTDEEIQNNLVLKNSKEDIIMHLAAEYLFTSFCSYDECYPYKVRDSKLYNDLTNFKVIYLQHGILYAHLPKMYSKEVCNIYNIIISSEFEKENLMNNYGYNAEDLIMTGMPRFGEEEKTVKKQNRILYAPSWRVYLIQDPPVNGERELREKQFLSSKYYQEINKLINNKELNEELKKNEAHLDIKLHPIFKGYIPYLKTDLSNIHVVEGNVNEKEYSLFITDFSSYQFDFARMNTPMIYFLPDEIEFKAGLHSYRELDLKLEDAFGDIAKTSDELKDLIIKSVKSGFKQPKKYSDRCNNFFVKEKDPQGKIYEIYKAGK